MAEEHLDVAAVQVEILSDVQKLSILKGGAAALGDSWGGMELLEGTLLTISQVRLRALRVYMLTLLSSMSSTPIR